MSTDRDVTRIVRSWMDEGVTQLPDRVLDLVLDQLPATPQRRPSWLARGTTTMNSTTIRLAIAAVAVAIAVFLGIRYLPGANIGGPPEATPTPAAPSPSESLPAGSYTTTTTFTLVPYTFTVPAGWIRNDAGALRGSDALGTSVRLTTFVITHVYADSCHWTGTLVPVGDRAALVAALTAQVGHTHSAPVETTIGGLPATKFVFTLDPAFDVATCDSSFVHLWPDPGPDESGGWGISPGQTETLFAIEANGKLMVLMTVYREDSPADDVAALQQILDSVVFQP